VKLFERVVFVLVGLILIILISVLFIVPDTLAAAFLGLADVNVVIRLGLALVLNALVLVSIYLRLRPGPASDATGLVVKAQGAMADVSVESAREMVLNAVNQVPGVSKAEVKLQAVRGKADIELDVTVVDSSTNVPKKQGEINRALKQVINKQLGLNMAGRPRVHIHLGDDSASKSTSGESVSLPKPAETKSAPPVEKTEDKTKEKEEPEEEPETENSGMFLRKDREPKPAEGSETTDSTDKGNGDSWLKSYMSGAESESTQEEDKGRT